MDHKKIISDKNRVAAQLNQLKNSELFTEEDVARLTPIYEKQLQQLEDKLSSVNTGSVALNTLNAVIDVLDIQVNQPQIVSNNQPGE